MRRPVRTTRWEVVVHSMWEQIDGRGLVTLRSRTALRLFARAAVRFDSGSRALLTADVRC